MSKDITIVDKKVPAVRLATSTEKYEAIEADLNRIQMNLIKVSDRLTIEFPKIVEFADSAQHPKMYEAVAKIASTISQVNKDAAAIIKQKQELYDSFRDKDSEPPTVNNTYNDQKTINNFHGTSNDLLDLVIQRKEEEE